MPGGSDGGSDPLPAGQHSCCPGRIGPSGRGSESDLVGVGIGLGLDVCVPQHSHVESWPRWG